MASFGAFMSALAPAASAAAYDPMLAPEANTMVGAVAPAAPQGFQRPKGFRNTIGKILDAVAIMGGERPGYQTSVDQQEAKFNEERKRNAFSNFLSNPTPETQTAFIQADPAGYEAYERSRMVKPQSAGSANPFVFAVQTLIDQGMTPQQAMAEAARYTRSEPAPIVRSGPGGAIIGIDRNTMAPTTIVPGQAPSAAGGGGDKAANYQIIQTATGFARVNKLTGEVEPLGADTATSASGGLSASDFGKAKGRLASLPAIRTTLRELESANPGLSGPIAGMIPGNLNADANAYDKAIGKLTQQIRGLTRVGGEGSISDFETRLNNLQLPSRTDTPKGRKAAIKQLQELVDDVESAYKGMTTPRRSAPAAAPSGGVVVNGFRFPDQKAADAYKRAAGIR